MGYWGEAPRAINLLGNLPPSVVGSRTSTIRMADDTPFGNFFTASQAAAHLRCNLTEDNHQPIEPPSNTHTLSLCYKIKKIKQGTFDLNVLALLSEMLPSSVLVKKFISWYWFC